MTAWETAFEPTESWGGSVFDFWLPGATFKTFPGFFFFCDALARSDEPPLYIACRWLGIGF